MRGRLVKQSERGSTIELYMKFWKDNSIVLSVQNA